MDTGKRSSINSPLTLLSLGVGRSVPLRSDIKGTELAPVNILIPLERQLIALQLCPDSFWATVCKKVRLCYRSVVCLSVTFMHCGQTVGRIKMKLGKQVGLVPGHIVLGGTQLPLP